MHHDIEPIEVIDTGFLQSAIRQASLLLHTSGSAFYVCKPAHDQLDLVASYGTAQEPWSEELLDRVCECRQAVMTAHTESAAVLAVPSVWRDTLHGVLVVTDDVADRTFNEQDAILLQSLAEMTAAALRQAERLTRMTAQFRALHTIDVALTSSLQLDRVLKLI